MIALYRGKLPCLFRVKSAVPQSRQAILTALCRDAALYRDTASLGDPLPCKKLALVRSVEYILKLKNSSCFNRVPATRKKVDAYGSQALSF